jgi:hypothetical protein
MNVFVTRFAKRSQMLRVAQDVPEDAIDNVIPIIDARIVMAFYFNLSPFLGAGLDATHLTSIAIPLECCGAFSGSHKNHS